MKVLVDIGNTNVLMGKYDNLRLIDQVRFETNTVISSPDDILKNLCIFLANVEYVLISGVVPQAQKNLRILISKNFENLSIRELNTSDLEAFIKFNVINPAEVGDDRIINSIAAIDKYEPPFIIVDFGTATTLDVVDKGGAYSGGLICPGVNLSIKSLSDGAALLPLITFKKPETLIGKHTIAAMESGIYWGYISLIEGLIERLKTSHECSNAKAIATGGLSKLFENDLKCINYFERDLTLEGLLIVSNKLQ